MPEADVYIPTPIDLLGELEHVRDKAMTHMRVFENRDGEVKEYEQPDYRAAIAAIRCKAEICGYIRQTPQFETPQVVRDAMRRALADPELRAMLVEQIRELEPGLLTEGKAK